MSHWWNPVNWIDDAEDLANDLADATTAIATSVADELVDVGNTLASTGNTIYNDIADGAVASFNTASGGVVYAVDWTETEATKISSYALSATGDIAHFSVDLYGKAKGWAEEAYRFLASALMSSPPTLGPATPLARDAMKEVLMSFVPVESAAESLLSMWERDAVKKGYTMAFDYGCSLSVTALGGQACLGVYIDNTGTWGLLLNVGASVSVSLDVAVELTIDYYMIFGGTSAYSKSYYFLGGSVDIEGFIVGADVIVNASFKFKGFKAKIGFGLEYELFSSGGSKGAKSAGSNSTDVDAGVTLPSIDIYSTSLLAEQASTTSIACDVVTDTSKETALTANASAAMTMKSTSILASDQAGGTGGDPFTDDITNVARIKSITLRGGSMVDGISITYVLQDGSTVKKSYGGDGGTATPPLTLADDEYITKVTGRSGTCVDQITFHTSYARTISAGGTGGNAFTIDPKVNRPIIGIFGRSGSLIDAIGVFYRSGHPFTLQSIENGLYLDVKGQMSADEGASTVQQTLTGGPNQHWLLSPGPEVDQYYIINAHTGLYLELHGGSSITQNTANGALSQLWGIYVRGNGYCYIVNQDAVGLSLGVNDGPTEAGAEATVVISNAGTNERWRLAPAPIKVYAFSNGGHTGSFQAFGPGKYDVGALTIGNDTIRSIRVPDCWRVTLYEHAGFTGSTQVLTRDAAELASMSGQVSSILIEMPPWGATIHKDASYKGTSRTLMPGRYASLSSLGFKDNTVSSVTVPSGWRVTLFAGEAFDDAATVLTSSTSNLATLGENDSTSSVVVESSPLGQVVLYEHSRYEGTSQVLGPGRHDVSVLEAKGCVGNDTVSSIKVPTNWTVILYEHSGYKGSSKTITADCAKIDDDFNDKTSSLIVIPG
jgi:hypothetical protein